MLQAHACIDRQYVVQECLLHHYVAGHLVLAFFKLGAFFRRVGLVGVPGVASPVLEVDSCREVVACPGVYRLENCEPHVVVGGVEQIVAWVGSGRVAVVDFMCAPVDERLHASVDIFICVVGMDGCRASENLCPHAQKGALGCARVIGLALSHVGVGAYAPMA